jgi:dolichol-phosphate mannosyltransferase
MSSMPNAVFPTKPSISLIVSALNEEAVVFRVLKEIYTEAVNSFDNFEIILIDDGSSDSTGSLMDEFAKEKDNITVVHNKTNLGLGAAFKLGFSIAKNQYIMLLCGDGGLPACSLPKIFESVGKADLIIPYMRNLKKIKSFSRYLLSRAYVLLLNSIFGFRLNYYNGLPVYPRLLLQSLEIKSNGFGFQGEILIKLLKSGCTYLEIEVEGAEETGNSKALKIKNIFSVGKTFFHLINEIFKFVPISEEIIKKSRVLQ